MVVSIFRSVFCTCIPSYLRRCKAAVLCYHKNLYSGDLGLVHTTLERFENGVFILKTHRMFSVHTTLEEDESATVTGHFVFVSHL